MRIAASALGLTLLAAIAPGAHAATASFDDLNVGSLPVPGAIQSGGVTLDITGPGSASIDASGAIGHSLRLNQSAMATVAVASGTSGATFYYYNVVSLSSLAVNGSTIPFTGLAGSTGDIGGVGYTVTSNPWGSFDRVQLAGPITSLSFTSGPTLNALILDEIAMVPEPSSCLPLLAAGIAGLERRAARTRRRAASVSGAQPSALECRRSAPRCA